MAYIKKHIRPRIAEVSCRGLEFKPGQCIAIKVYGRLDRDEKRKLRRTICKWAGCELRVLIYDGHFMDMEIERKPELPNFDF